MKKYKTEFTLKVGESFLAGEGEAKLLTRFRKDLALAQARRQSTCLHFLRLGTCTPVRRQELLGVGHRR